VNVSTEILDGVRVTVARFKLTKGTQLSDPAFDASRHVEVGEFLARKDLKSTTLELADNAYKRPVPGVLKATKVFGSDFEVTSYRAESGSTAMHNVVEFRFSEPRGKGQRWKKIAEMLDKLGIDSNVPTQESLQRLKRIKLLRYYAGVKVGPTEDLAERFAGLPKATQAKLLKVEKTTELRHVAPGQIALYSDGLAEELREKGLVVLSHQGTPADDRLDSLLRVGLLSSRERYHRGLMFKGMSTDQDFKTGGADSTFTRLAKAPTPALGRMSVDIDPGEIGRLDAYAFNEDEYGQASEVSFERRMSMLEAGKRLGKGRMGLSNELMLQRSIDPRAIRAVGLPSVQREAAIQRYRDNGITEINGIPLEEFFR
jgi:hypothetical protein